MTIDEMYEWGRPRWFGGTLRGKWRFVIAHVITLARWLMGSFWRGKSYAAVQRDIARSVKRRMKADMQAAVASGKLFVTISGRYFDATCECQGCTAARLEMLAE